MRYEFFIEGDNDIILDLSKSSLNKLGNINFKTDLNYFFRDIVCDEFNELDYRAVKTLSRLLFNENNMTKVSNNKFKIEGNYLPDLINRLQTKIEEADKNNKGIMILKGYDFKKKHFEKTIFCNKPKIIINPSVYSCEITYKYKNIYAGLLKWADLEEKSGPIINKWEGLSLTGAAL